MFWIRVLIFGFPAFLAAVLAASFLAVKLHPAPKENQMVTAGIGEAKVLNPIQSTTTADSEVNAYIFGSLLKYDENLEITGDHAASWELSQTTAFFFHNDAETQAAAEAIGQAAEQHADWHLESFETEDSVLRLVFSLPGSRASREILELFEPDTAIPLDVLRVTLKSSARESASHFQENAVTREQIRRLWVDSSTAYELTVTDPKGEVFAELTSYCEANPDLEATIERVATRTHLDEPRIVFHLHEGIRWHDGQPFTSADVDFTYRMIMDETIASPRRPDYELIASIETPDPHTVVVTYRQPYSPALLSWMMGILPQHVLTGKSSAWWAENFNRAPVGTGAFRFKEWRSNEFILLERNPDYFMGEPHLQEVAIRVIPDPVSMRLSFETGQVDFWGVSQHAVGGFENDERYELFASPAPSYEYVGWNLRREPFSDPLVRRAFAHAVDVDSIIRYVLYGYGEQSTGIFPPQMWFFNESVQPFRHDPDKARALLAEAGWKPGPDGILAKQGKRLTFDILTNQANDIRKDIATLVQADLKKIGADVGVQIYEWAVFISQYVDKGDFDAVVLGWSLGFDYDQYQIWHSSQSGPGQLNFVGYDNPEADRLLSELRTSFDRDEIKSLAGDLQQTIYEDQPYLFLYVPKNVAAMHRGAFRVRRPVGAGWEDEPVRQTKAGFRHYRDWFYRPEYPPEDRP